MNKVAGEMKFLGGATGLKTNLPGFEYSGRRITMVRTIDTHTHTACVNARATHPEPKKPLLPSKHSSDKRGHWFEPN